MYQRNSFNSGDSSSSSISPAVPPPTGMYQRQRSVASSNPSMYPNDYDVSSSSAASLAVQAGSSSTSSAYQGRSTTAPSWFSSFGIGGGTPAKYKSVDDDDLKYNHPSGSKNRFYSTKDILYWRIIPCLILIVLPWIPTQMTRSTVYAKQKVIKSMMEEQTKIVADLDEATENIRSLEKELVTLSRENELNYQELDRAGKLIKTQELSTKDGYEEQEKEEEALVERIDSLEQSVRTSALRRLEQRYGGGPYRFRINIVDESGIPSSFNIQTPLVMEMPHAIDHFVKMVEGKLWDGLTFVHEYKSTVVMATPMTKDPSHTWAGQRFTDAKLTHMAFTEQSKSYPTLHNRKYSVAFSGRPGGPSFYINMENEMETAHEHESAFGVVMEGRDILQQFYSKNHKNGDEKKMLSIESIEMLTNTISL